MEYKDIKVIKRDGRTVKFDTDKLVSAITRAFISKQGETAKSSHRVQEQVARMVNNITQVILKRSEDKSGRVWHIEEIQDYVELELMRSGEVDIAKEYILYRDQKTKARGDLDINWNIKIAGRKEKIDTSRFYKLLEECTKGLNRYVSKEDIIKDLKNTIYDGMEYGEWQLAPVLVTRTLVEKDPEYSVVAARFLMDKIREEVMGEPILHKHMAKAYAEYFQDYIRKGVKKGLLHSKMLSTFDLEVVAKAIQPDRDMHWTYQGLQILYDRYLIRADEKLIELPQALWMRVAMGLAWNEADPNQRAIEFYEVLSTHKNVSSTPTLFNSGTVRPQLSSCYLTHVEDDLSQIYESIKDNALLSKFAGGLGNDWTSVRSLGSTIRGTNGKSQGVIPFLKVVNDTAVAVNQGGKRKGAVCAYLETWHLDIEEFLELRRNVGDERRRTHDMNTANWVPDLFLQRVEAEGDWTLFSPSDVPDLHDLYGKAFKEQYEKYEKMAEQGKIKLFKKVKAVDLWRKMLTMLFETGHPWITFKDACNIRSPQQHAGVVHSSNLCTEITLNTSADEIAVCNLSSINISAFIQPKPDMLETIQNRKDWLQFIHVDDLRQSVKTAMRMLDNVIDINFYAVEKARNSNMLHRPVGLGTMGFADALMQMGLPYTSEKAMEFADVMQELISYYAIEASSELAQERGSYSSFEGSLWSKGVLPADTIGMLAAERGNNIDVHSGSTLNWDALREKVVKGMRNSNCLAIAPTATISNIVGVSQSIEPIYQNLYVKSNLSGEFTVLNKYLVRDLKQLGLWDAAMVKDIKYYDGSISQIPRIPDSIKDVYKTAFEIEPEWLIEATSRRMKWIDQSASLNLYMREPSGRKLDQMYRLAWHKGLKTTYYLRSMGASSAEKSTVDRSVLNAVPSQMCPIDDPSCEACQ